MPELNMGARQGDALPLYLAVKTVDGDMIDQPLGSPTITIVYVEPDTNARRISINTTSMKKIELGRYFYVWRIAKDEPCLVHKVIMKAFIEDVEKIATDESYMTSALQDINPTFSININVVKGFDICYPEVMGESPRCRPHPHITRAHGKEVDIGLNDYEIEGVFRFGQFPNQVVDRRVVGRYSYTYGTGTGVPSEMPGGGPAARPGNPTSNYTRYRNRQNYRY